MKKMIETLFEVARKLGLRITLKLVLLLWALVLAFSLQPSAFAQNIPLKIYWLTNTPYVTSGTNLQLGLTNGMLQITNGSLAIGTGGSSNILSQTFPIWRDRGFQLNIACYTTNASGSNVNATVRFASVHSTNGVTGGGLVTNWGNNTLVVNFANNGTNGETFFSTNIQKTLVDNQSIGQLTTVTNNHLSTLFLDPTNTFISVLP